MSESTTVQLRKPIQHGSEVITQLTLRPLKGKDMRRLKASTDQPMAMIIELAGYLSGQVTQVIDELEGEDLREVMQAVSGFLGGGLTTGAEP